MEAIFVSDIIEENGKTVKENESHFYIDEDVNYIVTIDDFNGHREIKCKTVDDVRSAVLGRSFDGIYNVSSPTGMDISEFITF